MELLESLSAPGCILNVTHITQQAFNGDQDISDMCFMLHEIPGHIVGKDQYGNSMASDPFWKNRMTSGKAVTFHPVKNSDRRESTVSVARCMGTTIAASNEDLGSTESAMMQRFMRQRMRRAFREDMPPEETIFYEETLDDESQKEEATHGRKLQHAYLVIIEKMIEAKVLPDVKVSVAREASRAIFKEMEKRGIPMPPRRPINMFLDICRIFTIYAAISAGLFSELGLKYREEPDPEKPGATKPRRFELSDLFNLAKYFQCSEEIAVHVFTLMEDIWIPKLESDIVQTIAKTILPCSATADMRWKPSFGNGCITPITPFRRDYDRESKTGIDEGHSYDYRYIQMTDNSFRMIASKIQSGISDRPSANDILSTLLEMKYKYIRSKRKQVEIVEVGKDAQGFSIVEERLVDVPDAPAESIPCVILEENPRNRQQKHLSIAVDMIDKNLHGLLRTCIKEALEHKHAPTRTYITGINFHREREQKDARGRPNPDMTNETWYNVFDTITLERCERQKVIKNYSSWNNIDIAILHNRIGDKYADLIGMRKRKQCPGWYLDKPLDYIHMVSYWVENGFPIKDSEIAYPPTTRLAVWRIREKDPRYRALDKYVIKKYPDDFIAAVDEKLEEINVLECNAQKYLENPTLMKKEAPLYSDIITNDPDLKPEMTFNPDEWGEQSELIANFLPQTAQISSSMDEGENPDDDFGDQQEPDHTRVLIPSKKQRTSDWRPRITATSEMDDRKRALDDILVLQTQLTKPFARRRTQLRAKRSRKIDEDSRYTIF